MQLNIVRVPRHCCWCLQPIGERGKFEEWSVHIVMGTWLHESLGGVPLRPSAVYSTTAYDLFHPKTYYIYIYTYTFNNNNIYSIHAGIIITGMRARMWYYVCVRSGRKTSFEHNNRQRATVWELRCIRGAAAGLKEWEWQGEGGP